MPKQTSRKRVASEEYGSDGGFVDDAPKPKKSKGNNAKPVDQQMKVDTDGNAFWDLSGKRRLGISEYKNTTMVNLREYYEKDGNMLPGKKGISLSLEQFTTFVELLPQVEKALKNKGVKVPRPQYDTQPAQDTKVEDEEDEGDDDDDNDEPVEKPSKSKGRLDKFKMDAKPNHEATSDEDED